MKCDRVLRIVFASKKLAVAEGGKIKHNEGF
jgi:hypothetical protein